MPNKDKNIARINRRRWYHSGDNYKREMQRAAERRAASRQWIDEYKKALKCKKCGFSNPLALDFHHKNRSEKTMTISKMVVLGYSIEKILKEIKICVVLCANCHRIEHGGQQWKSSVSLQPILHTRLPKTPPLRRKQAESVSLICPVCNTLFLMRKARYLFRKEKTKQKIFLCSKHCSSVLRGKAIAKWNKNNKLKNSPVAQLGNGTRP